MQKNNQKQKKGKPGIPWSEESKKKLSQSAKGRKISQETREKLRNCNLGKNMGVKPRKNFLRYIGGENTRRIQKKR